MPGMEDYGQPDDSGWGIFNAHYQNSVLKAAKKQKKKKKKKKKKGKPKKSKV